VPVNVFVTEPPPERPNTTETFEPGSAVKVTTPPVCVASVLVAPFDTPMPSASTGAVGAAVSSTNEVVPAALTLPAASVAVAFTSTVPSPSVVKSSESNNTATGVVPLPVTVLLTELEPRVNKTLTVAPDSAVSFTTPLACVASALIAPLETPAPSVNAGAEGAAVSSV
jgi:hypothetical protein